MLDVAADHDLEAVDAILVIANRQQIEQSLRRMRVIAVSGVQNRRLARVRGESRRRAVFLVAHDECVAVHRLECGQRVFEAFALAGR